MKAPAKEEIVPFELGKKRGKVYVPQYNEAELEAIRRKEAVAEAVRLDDDEEAALGGASTNDLMTLAEILDSNPQVLEKLFEAIHEKNFLKNHLQRKIRDNIDDLIDV